MGDFGEVGTAPRGLGGDGGRGGGQLGGISKPAITGSAQNSIFGGNSGRWGLKIPLNLSSHHGAAVMNLTRNHEVSGSIPGLAQWVKDPMLL